MACSSPLSPYSHQTSTQSTVKFCICICPCRSFFSTPFSAVQRPIQSCRKEGHIFQATDWFQAYNILVDRLKPVFSDEKVSPALPPLQGRPPRRSPPSVVPTFTHSYKENDQICTFFSFRLVGIRPELPRSEVLSPPFSASASGGSILADRISATTSTLFLSTSKSKMF